MDALFAALADPRRRALLDELIAHGPATATSLAASTDISRQGVAKHLGVLADADLVFSERFGRENRYSPAPQGLDQLVHWATATQAAWTARLNRLAQALEPGP